MQLLWLKWSLELFNFHRNSYYLLLKIVRNFCFKIYLGEEQKTNFLIIKQYLL